MAARSSKRRNVKSVPAAAADAHERRKDFLTDTEVTALLDAVKAGRHGVRNYLLVLMMYRHGLRVSEATDLRRDEIDFDRSRLWVRRLKSGLSVEQPIPGDELRAMRRYLALRYGCPAVVVPLRARTSAHPSGGQRSPRDRGAECGACSGAASHAASFLRLSSCQPRLRPSPHPGLSRSSRPQAHCSLHTGCRQSVRESLALIADFCVMHALPAAQRQPRSDDAARRQD